MACWHVLNKSKSFRKTKKQAEMENCFKSIWCHMGNFDNDDNIINRYHGLMLYFWMIMI
jgi:hypothetical protein